MFAAKISGKYIKLPRLLNSLGSSLGRLKDYILKALCAVKISIYGLIFDARLT